MIYMVGGPPRMGKSTMAQKVLQEYKIPYVSTDGLTVMLKPVGQPSFYNPEKANRFFPYLQLFIDRISKSAPDYLIEGDAFSPQHVIELQKTYNISAVFLTMSSINPTSVISNAGFDKWTDKINEAQLASLCERIVTASNNIATQCTETGLASFDLAVGYKHQFERAYQHLLNRLSDDR